MRQLLLVGVMAWGLAIAQSGGETPLVSVGDGFRWEPSSESYRLTVGPEQAGLPVNLEVYSPHLNLDDYVNQRATATYYGDERYNNQPFSTTFSLEGAGGVVFSKTYQSATVHTWERLIGTPLPVGTYTLKVRSVGQGKNAFALRTAPGFRLEASQFSVNARGTPTEDLLAAQFRVGPDLVGKQVFLVNYDGDGPSEVQLVAVQPNAQRRPLAISANGSSATDILSITAETVGEWSILARIPASTRQYSNALSFKLEVERRPFFANLPGFVDPKGTALQGPVIIETVDPDGKAIPGASYTYIDCTAKPVLPTGWRGVSASVLEGSGRVISNTEACVPNGPARVRFIARRIEGQLEVRTVALVGETRVPLSGIPVQTAGQTQRTPFVLTLNPGEYPAVPTPLPGATTANANGTVREGERTLLTLEYRVQTQLQLVVSPDVVDVGGISNIVAVASTLFPYKVPVTLGLSVSGAGNQLLQGAQGLQGEISADQPLRLTGLAKSLSNGSVQGRLATTGLRAEVPIQVRNLSNNAVYTSARGELRYSKTLRFDAENTAAVSSPFFNVTLSLEVSRAVQDLRIQDPLPQGEAVQAVRGPISFSGGAVRLEGNTLFLGNLQPGRYTLSYSLFTTLPAAQALTIPELNWNEAP